MRRRRENPLAHEPEILRDGKDDAGGDLPESAIVEKVYGFVLREGPEVSELLVFQHAGMPEAGLQVPGGTVEQGETPIEAVAREVLEESGLPLDGWQLVVTPETGVRGWHCFATAPSKPLPDIWSWEPAGPEAAEGLRFEYRWVALEAGEALARAQEKARRAGLDELARHE